MWMLRGLERGRERRDVCGGSRASLSLSTPQFVLESHCLQAQQVWFAASPVSLPEPVLVETEKMQLWVRGCCGPKGCQELVLSSSYLGINPTGSPRCLPESFCFVCIDEGWRDIPNFVWQAHISGSFSN